MDRSDFDNDDPDRHLKRIHKLVGISTKIQMMAAKRRSTFQEESKEERDERILVFFQKLSSFDILNKLLPENRQRSSPQTFDSNWQ